MKEEIIINIQLALFFEQPLNRPDDLYHELNEKMGGLFDQTPTIIPVPNEQQLLDLPIVQMTSNNGIYSCNIARGRVDFFHQGEGKIIFKDIKEKILNEADNFVNFFESKTKIKRFGFVTRFFVKDENQDKTIAKLLNTNFRKLHNGNTEEAFIRYVSRLKIDEFEINNFTTLERFFARIIGVGDNIKGILITRDFNSNPNISYSGKFNTGKIKKIIEEGEIRFKLEDIKSLLW